MLSIAYHRQCALDLPRGDACVAGKEGNLPLQPLNLGVFLAELGHCLPLSTARLFALRLDEREPTLYLKYGGVQRGWVVW